MRAAVNVMLFPSMIRGKLPLTRSTENMSARMDTMLQQPVIGVEVSIANIAIRHLDKIVGESEKDQCVRCPLFVWVYQLKGPE